MPPETTPAETTPPKNESAPEKVNVLDLEDPVYLVFHQTTAQNKIEIFTGPDAEANALARASQKSVTTKARVAVFGPQRTVYEPPQETKAVEVQLKFGLDTA